MASRSSAVAPPGSRRRPPPRPRAPASDLRRAPQDAVGDLRRAPQDPTGVLRRASRDPSGALHRAPWDPTSALRPRVLVPPASLVLLPWPLALRFSGSQQCSKALACGTKPPGRPSSRRPMAPLLPCGWQVSFPQPIDRFFHAA
jgi:hypothetical protein